MMRILVVEDEALFAQAIGKQLGRAGHDCVLAGTLTEAHRQLDDGVQLVLLDERLPDGSGLDLLANLVDRETPQAPAVIVMTAFGDIDHAVAAMKLGAADYLQKPLDLDELSRSVEKVGRAVSSPAPRERPPRPTAARDHPRLVGTSSAMAAARRRIEELARIATVARATPLPTVLILGETGTGKDLAARLLHALGPRADEPFVHIDCASLPKELIEDELFGHERGAFTGARDRRDGLVRIAHGGTVFLDEIGELPLELQAKLLSLLDRRRLRPLGGNREVEVGARFVAATNRDLAAMVADGAFRSDLYYRLNVLTLTMPALRDCGGDVARLARHFADLTVELYGGTLPDLTDEAVARLTAHSWDGNCRELKHAVERAVLLNRGAAITAEEIERSLAVSPDPPTPAGQAGPETGLSLDQAERRLIETTLRRTRGNVSEAARLLDTSRMRLRYRMEKHGIKAARDNG